MCVSNDYSGGRNSYIIKVDCIQNDVVKGLHRLQNAGHVFEEILN
ncbi:hypothetical protein ACJIZ3_022038 [Penstemon smallii]|uniref:Uncharacterized protein n=1 Tax=Penstemon smallii TaxID=265156 RepID=A0ABD3SN63_9LAMI